MLSLFDCYYFLLESKSLENDSQITNFLKVVSELEFIFGGINSQIEKEIRKFIGLSSNDKINSGLIPRLRIDKIYRSGLSPRAFIEDQLRTNKNLKEIETPIYRNLYFVHKLMPYVGNNYQGIRNLKVDIYELIRNNLKRIKNVEVLEFTKKDISHKDLEVKIKILI